MTAVAVGDKITADLGNSWRIKYVQKAANETVTSSVALQNDNDFVFTIAANTMYAVIVFLSASGAAAGDLKVAWSVTGTVTSPTGRHTSGPDAGVASSAASTLRQLGGRALTSSEPYGTDGTTAGSIREDFLISGGAAGGTLTMQWAQNTSNATGTTLSTASYVLLEVVDVP